MSKPGQKIVVSEALRVAYQHHQAGRLSEAEAIYRQVLAVDPDCFDALYLLGTIACQTGNYEQGVDFIDKAIRRFPSNPFPHYNLGEAYRLLGRLDEAEACFKKSLSLKPDNAQAHYSLGIVLQTRARFDEAETSYRSALTHEPGMVLAHYNLGTVLKNRGCLDEALASYQAALALKPDYAEARWGLAMARIPEVCGPDDDPEAKRNEFAAELTALEVWFDDNHVEQAHMCVGLQQPFFLAYQEENNRDLLSRYGALCSRLMEGANIGRGGVPAKKDASQKVRVGIVSAHLYDQSVWNAIVKGWYGHLDREQFELDSFYLDSKYDSETAQAQSCSAWFAQGPKSLGQWIEAIRARQPDVLIYPEIGMDPMTVRLASLRLAPVQVATWGHPETSGLPTMDYYLSAEDFEPLNAQDHYSEKLVRLPHLGCCYRPSSVVAVEPDFSGWNIEPGVPVFVCPGTPFKYAPQHDRIFVELAKSVERCRFVFFDHYLYHDLSGKLHRRLETAFARAGLDFHAYAVFLPWQPRAAFYGLLQRADVYLDTIGFSGFNTAMQAVECGLPLVTREGRFLRGRFGSGILRRLGLPELIARTEEDYIALALRLARDGDYRRKIRERLEACRHVLYGDLASIGTLEDFLREVVKRR